MAPGSGSYLLVKITDEGNGEDCALGHAEREIAIQSGRCSRGGSLEQDGCAHKGLTVLVGNDTCHL